MAYWEDHGQFIAAALEVADLLFNHILVVRTYYRGDIVYVNSIQTVVPGLAAHL